MTMRHFLILYLCDRYKGHTRSYTASLIPECGWQGRGEARDRKTSQNNSSDRDDAWRLLPPAKAFRDRDLDAF